MYSYQIGDSLYLNVTNQCTNRCDFCVRNTTKGLSGKSLWLDREPTAQEVLDSIDDPTKYKEIVFCGFGEPLSRVEVVADIARQLRSSGVPIRVNTNGQANLIHQRDVVPQLAGLIDVISISLNAENAHQYQAICQSDFGPEAFQAILDFTSKCKGVIPSVILSVVNRPDVNIAACRKIAQELGVELRVREWSPEL